MSSVSLTHAVATSTYENLDITHFIKENKLDWVQPSYVTSLLEESTQVQADNENENENENEAEVEVDVENEAEGEVEAEAEAEAEAEVEAEGEGDDIPERSLSEHTAEAELTIDLALAVDMKVDVNAKNPPVCTDDSKSRIRFCLNILGEVTTLQDSTVKYPGKYDDHCKKLYNNPGQAVQRATCAKFGPTLLANPQSWYPLLRSTDPHNICLNLLNQASMIANDQTQRCKLDPNLTEETPNGIPAITGLRCLFLHGVGEAAISYPDGPAAPPNAPRQPFAGMFTHYRAYWGHIHLTYEHACDVRIFVTDTVTRGWVNPDVQQEYCDKVAQWKPHIVFTHSMGNMILGGAIANKLPACANIVTAAEALAHKKVAGGKHVTFWGGVQGPLLGSPLVTFLKKICTNWLLGKIKGLGQKNRCANKGLQPSYNSLMPDFVMEYSPQQIAQATQVGAKLPQLNCPNVPANSVAHPLAGMFGAAAGAVAPNQPQCVTLKDIAKQYQYSSMCGMSSAPLSNIPGNMQELTGLFTDIGTTILDKINSWPNGDDKSHYDGVTVTGNDGLVGFSSCRVEGAQYTQDPTNRFYAVAASHNAARCTYGENSKNQAEQPCSWFKAMITNRRVAEGLAPNAPAYNFFG